MKETRADTRRALVEAIGLHALLFGMMFAGLQWTRSNVAEPSQGDPIEADLVDPSALSAAMRSALQRAPEAPPEPVVEAPVETSQPEPLPEPIREEQPPAPEPEPEPVEQEKVQRDAPTPAIAKTPREQEAKRKQPEQADLDAKKQAEQERQRQQLANLRKQLDKARAQTQMELQRQQQLADARSQTSGNSQTSPPPGNRGTDAGLLAKYRDALQSAIARQWTRPESVQLGQRCRIAIRQLPGGEVVDVTISPSCPFDELGRQSVERAVLKASPLPYAGFESVFNRNLDLNFVAEER